MATIYDFNTYRAPRLLRTFSQQASGVSHQLLNLHGQLDDIHAQIDDMQGTYDAFANTLGRYIIELDKTRKDTETCLEACELDSVEQMIKARDKIAHDRHEPPPREQRH